MKHIEFVRRMPLKRVSRYPTIVITVLLSAKVEVHRNGAEPNDDLTMMCMRIAE
jgi:hypothetical protein